MDPDFRRQYLGQIVEEMKVHWPNNRRINIVCHGHSVPAGYFATPLVNTFHAYPHLLHKGLKERFPYAVVNVIVTAVGGENSITGLQRLDTDVLCHKPDIMTIDYALTDRRIGLTESEKSWRSMIEKALGNDVKVILLTPSMDINAGQSPCSEEWKDLEEYAIMIRNLADEYHIGLADSFAAFEKYIVSGGDITDLLSWSNHPNGKGHELIAQELLRWFTIY